MESLLQKTRRLNKTLQSYGSKPVSFAELSKILSRMLDANVYIANTNGKVLGYELSEGFQCDIVQSEIVKEKRFPKKYNDELLKYNETKENIKEVTGCVFDQVSKCDYPDKISTIIPISSGGKRLGTLVLARFGKEFTEEDLVLAEYSATIVGMEILKAKSEEIELEAMEHIFRELDGNEGLLVASKIADRVGITRSVIVNALRKFESAGVIETRSLGMKGTHIKILNDKLKEELLKAKE